LTLLVGRQEGHQPHKKNMGDGGGEHWLVWMEWRPSGWSMFQKFSSGTGSPGWSQKKGRKTVVVVVVVHVKQTKSSYTHTTTLWPLCISASVSRHP